MLPLFILAACATSDPRSLDYGKREVGIDEAFVLPSNHSVVGITQERASNGITQTISLSTNSGYSGANYFRVTMMGPVDPTGASEHSLSYQPLTDGRISRELRTEMAGITMARSPFYVQNNYGPFSYATGKTAGGDSCIYAWQQIRSPAAAKNFFQNRGRIDLRLRLCETGATQEQLLASMYEFTINATIAVNGWNPYGEPAGPSADIGRMGNPLMAPGVNSSLSGIYPTADLNAARLNAAAYEATTAPPRAAAVQKPAPALRQSSQPAYTENAQQVTLPSHYTPPQVTVPAPQQAAAATGLSAKSVKKAPLGTPQKMRIVPAATGDAQVSAPDKGLPDTGLPDTGLIVPPPCKLPTNSSSGSAGQITTVCP